MFFSTHILLSALERRHGPLHIALVAAADQWRWKRQLAAIAKNPSRTDFGMMQVVHERIGAIDPKSTSSEALVAVKQAWQKASDAMAPVVDTNDRIWLERHRLVAR